MLAYLLYLSAYTVFRQGIARFANTVPYHKKILGLSHEREGKFDSIVKDTQTSHRQPMSIIAKKKYDDQRYMVSIHLQEKTYVFSGPVP